MNFSVNNHTPSFKGIYVINGTGKETKQYASMMNGLRDIGLQSYEIQHGYNPNNKIAPGITDIIDKLIHRMDYSKTAPNGEFPRRFAYRYITRLYGDEQNEVKLLVTTDKDADILDAWYSKYWNQSPVKPIRCKFAHEKLTKEEIKEMINQTKSLLKKYQAEMADYNYAKSGYDDRELDFILEKNKEADIVLEQLKEFTNKAIRIFNYKEIMEAIHSGKFNPVTGILKVR